MIGISMMKALIYLIVLLLVLQIEIGCRKSQTKLPLGSKLADSIAYGHFKKYSEIEQIDIYFYYQVKKIKYLDELRNKKKIVITNQDEIFNFIKNLEDYQGRIGQKEKLMIHGICIIKLTQTFTYFNFGLYEKSVYIQPPSFADEVGGHGQANTKIFPTLYQLLQKSGV